ncbi:hypothetical protein ACFQV2_07490 [Actinokineospora soli]|uniref:Macro domain-containing protein n=1 Tax=Actinokineospora soli TaxID=1048753 RepID=A0ABW2TKI0_9PSEU
MLIMVAVADEFLGVVNGVRVELAETVEPWGLGADALAVPVGNVLGALGTSLATAFTHARLALTRVDLPAIHSAAPIVLGPSEPPYGAVRFLVLLSPHDSADGEVDAGSIATATRAAVLAAAQAGATGLALPLPGTGALRIAGETAAAARCPPSSRRCGRRAWRRCGGSCCSTARTRRRR